MAKLEAEGNDGKVHVEKVAHCAHCSETWSIDSTPEHQRGLKCPLCKRYVCKNHRVAIWVGRGDYGPSTIGHVCEGCGGSIAKAARARDYAKLVTALVRLALEGGEA